jgi:hypothetical protein
MRLIFLNRFFYPDHAATSELLSDLAFALAQRGFSVTVIASRQDYETAAASFPPRDNINGSGAGNGLFGAASIISPSMSPRHGACGSSRVRVTSSSPRRTPLSFR